MSKRLWTAILVYLAVITASAIWMANSYDSLFMFLADWQFDHLGIDLPAGTIILIAVLPIAPVLLMVALVRHRANSARVARIAAETDQGTVEKEGEAGRASALACYRLFAGFAAAFAICAVVAGAMVLFVPGRGSGAGRIDIARIGLGPPLPDGPATVSGGKIEQRVVVFRQTAIADDGLSAFAAVHGRKGEPPVLYVELPHSRAGVVLPPSLVRSPMHGVLVRNGLPGPVRSLFAEIGNTVPDPHFVLYQSLAPLRRPYLAALAQFAILGAVCGLAAWAQSNRVRRFDRQSAGATGNEGPSELHEHGSNDAQ